METREQIERIEHFIREVVVDEITKLQGVGLSYMQFVIMGQAIEVLGSFLDNKPMKAKGQSAKRFSLGVKKLFGGRYRFLYDKLRNQMTHTFIPGSDLISLNQADNKNGYKHLQIIDGKLVLISEVFNEDIHKASERLLEAIKNGVLSPKNIAY